MSDRDPDRTPPPRSGRLPAAERSRRQSVTSGPGGPTHMRATRQADRETRRALVQAALDRLRDDRGDPFPSVGEILEAGGGAFSRSRVYDEAELVESARAAWRGRREGRADADAEPVPAAPGRGADGVGAVEGRDGVVEGGGVAPRRGSASASASASASESGKLVHALEVLAELRERNARLSSANLALREENVRLRRGIHDDLWPEDRSG